jgi:four helix bundle protein
VIGNNKKEFKKRMYAYVLRLIRFLVKIPDTSVVREIKSQLTRSGTSVGANYFEALAASSKKDFQNYFRYALKSANETRFWLALLRDGNLLAKDLREEDTYLLQETRELANIFASSIITMKGNRK